MVRRDGHFDRIDVNGLVPGDVIRLEMGELVPADVRLIDVNGLECNQSILTGESVASEKSAEPAGVAADDTANRCGCRVNRGVPADTSTGCTAAPPASAIRIDCLLGGPCR